MPTAEALVRTDRPSRYLVQICRHFSHRGRHLGPRRPAFLAPELMSVEWTQTHGVVSFGWGSCAMEATSDGLALRAEAANDEDLQRVKDVVARHLGRYARRDRLTVTWQPSASGALGRG